MSQLLREFRLAARAMLRSPGLTAVAVVALALGIGLTTTMFSIVNGVVLQGLPFEESDRILHVERTRAVQGEGVEVPIHDYLDWRRDQHSFEDLGAFYTGTAYLADGAGQPARYDGGFVTASSLSLLRVSPQLGRLIQEGEDRPGAELVLLLGHRVWQDRYHGDPNVLGRSARINGQAATIVGVMPEGFRFPIAEELWVPLRLDPLELPRGEGMTLEVIGRLKPGVTPEQANAELAGIAQRLETAYPEANAGVGVDLKPYVTEFIGEEPIALLFTMLGAVFGVLLIACANVANLLLARATLRTREVAIRSALGASRARVIGQHLAESTVLAVLGAGLGLGLAAIGIRLFNDVLVARAPGVPFWFDIGINPRVALFVVLLSGIASLLAGIFPAIQASNADFNAVLKDESRGSSSFRLGRFSRILVITEVALSCSLLVGAALMIKTVVQLDRFEPEFLTEEVFTSRLGLFEADYPDVESRRRFYRELRQRLAGRPGVEEAAISTGLPGWRAGQDGFAVDGVGYASEKDHP